MRYAEHRFAVPSWQARHARLVSITLACFTISLPPPLPLPFIGYARTEIYRVPFDPPLRDFGESRRRLVAMDQDAIVGLHRHPITVKSYKLPRKFWQITIMALSIFTYLLAARRRALLPGHGNNGGPLLRTVASRFPSLFSFLHRTQPMILWPLVAAHLIEAVFMSQKRLRSFSVPLLSTLWWKWTLSTFLEGYGAFCRLDEMVGEEEARRNRQKH